MSTKANIGARIELSGEKEYRQSIASVSKSMSVLKSDLRAVSAEFDGNANSLDALKAKNEIYIKQQSEQEKKLATLRGALDSVTEKYGENSKQAQDWQIKLNNAYSELNKINRELSTNEKYMDEAKSSTDKTAKSIDEFGKEVKNSKEETLKFGDVLKANLAGEAIVKGIEMMGRAIKEVAKATVDVVKDTAAYADNILTLSAQTGIATNTLQELSYMAELTDVSLDDVTKTMARNIRSMASAKEGTKLYTDAYRQLGIEVTNADGQLRSSESVYWEVVDALGRMANETERDAIAMQLFGRSAQDLNPLIKIGADGMARFSEEAQNMGAVLSDDTLKGLGETDDALQRLTQQFEISKRKVAIEMAPAMTEAIGKISEKVDDVDDKFADFAGGALTDTVDAFIWLVDHSNLITSGLKGIVAAIITKKAADGVTYAIQAYKTLTTATQTATAAQIAFNTASKANVIGAIASVVIGLGTALVSYSKSTEDASDNTVKLTEKIQTLTDKSKELREEVEKKIEAWKEETESIEAEYGAMETLASKLYELSGKENKSNGEKQQMVSLVNQLNEIIPNLNLKINEQTGYLSLQREEMEKLIASQKDYYLVKAAEENYTEIARQRAEAEMLLNDLYDERINKNLEIQRLQYTLASQGGIDGQSAAAWDRNKIAIDSTNRSLQGARNELNALEGSIKTQEGALASADEQWQKNEEYIKKYTSSLDSAGSSLDSFGQKYKEALENQTEAEIRTLDDRMDLIEDIYEEAEDALDKKLEAEEKAIEKSQKKQSAIVEKAQEKELKSLEKAHKKKLALIDEEYLEKIKTVDEEKYNKLKKIQDEIDGIDTKQEAEDRASELVEEARERAEIQARLDSAKTAEEKIELQEELATFDKKIARERLKTERALQKDVLKEQKDTIEDVYDKKVESLKEEQKIEKTAIDDKYKADKEAISKRHKQTLDALAEEQKLEKENLAEKQKKYKDYLKDQKVLASRNAKAIYEDDLAQYKLNQALKYDQAVNDERSMKKIIQDYAYNSMDPGKDRDAILRTNSLDEMLKYYNPSALLKTATPSQTPGDLNYDLFGRAVKDALKGVKIELNGKAVGTIVESTVNNMLR